MTEEIEDRLEFHEPGSDTEHEIWKDPITGKFYKVEIEVTYIDTPLITSISETDLGFLNTVTPANLDTFNAGK